MRQDLDTVEWIGKRKPTFLPVGRKRREDCQETHTSVMMIISLRCHH